MSMPAPSSIRPAPGCPPRGHRFFTALASAMLLVSVVGLCHGGDVEGEVKVATMAALTKATATKATETEADGVGVGCAPLPNDRDGRLLRSVLKKAYDQPISQDEGGGDKGDDDAKKKLTERENDNTKDDKRDKRFFEQGTRIRSGRSLAIEDENVHPREKYRSHLQGLKPFLKVLLTAEARSIDGKSTNVNFPRSGAAGTPLLRMAPADYGGDGTGAVMAGQSRPGPREISNALMQNGGLFAKRKNTRGLSDMLWQWGQFLDHELVLTPTNTSFSSESRPIAVPLGDEMLDPDGTGGRTIPFSRSVYAPDANGIRQQINGLTSHIDASVVYGSDDVRASALRTFEGGMLLTSNNGQYMPFNTEGLPNAPHGNTDPNLFLGGEERSNEQIGLTAMHTLFVREHNLCAQTVADMFNGEATGNGQGVGSGKTKLHGGAPTDEDIYQLCRRLIGAEMQAITYNEFLPAILGRRTTGQQQSLFPPYDTDLTYNPAVDPSISNEFSIAYRVGHIMLTDAIQIVDHGRIMSSDGPVPLENAFFNSVTFLQRGVDSILRGLAAQHCHDVEPMVVEAVRSMLFGPSPHAGMDLAALNVQRGRDHGLASYNKVRESYGLARAATFADVTSDNRIASALRGLYGSVDDIDLWVGCVAEDHYGDAIVGQTLFTILMDQFNRLREGDRFWYERDLGKVSEKLVAFVNRQHLSEVIVRNTGIVRQDIPRLAMAGAWI